MLHSKISVKRQLQLLDFDIENMPLTYLGSDFTTAQITAIAASFDSCGTMYCWTLRNPQNYLEEMRGILESFVQLYNEADVITGHYIRMHDLPMINGALLECGLPPLSPKLTSDTKVDLISAKGISKSQESLSDLLGVRYPKIGMSQGDWRHANRFTPEGIESTVRRVTGDVRQHQEMRRKLLELGMLREPRMWRGGSR